MSHEIEILMPLESVLYGFPYSHTVQRNIWVNGSLYKTAKDFSLYIPPGTEAGQRFEFPNEGDQSLDNTISDVVFVTKDEPHKHFTRNGANIEFLVQLTRSQTSKPFKILVPLLEGIRKWHQVQQPIFENCKHEIQNSGLPYHNDYSKRGNLVLQFVILDNEEKKKTFLQKMQILSDLKDRSITHEFL